jgi:hypothetical protein
VNKSARVKVVMKLLGLVRTDLSLDLRCLGQIHWSDGPSTAYCLFLRACLGGMYEYVRRGKIGWLQKLPDGTCQTCCNVSTINRGLVRSPYEETEHLCFERDARCHSRGSGGCCISQRKAAPPCSIARARARASDPCVELLGRNRGGQRNVIPMIHCLASWRDVMKKEDWRLVSK